MQSLKKTGLNGMPSIFYERVHVCARTCVRIYVHAFMFTSMGSTLLSSSLSSECVSVCVFLHSPQGLFQLRAKNTVKL